jgi:predicted metalloprotease with PDZ domain
MVTFRFRMAACIAALLLFIAPLLCAQSETAIQLTVDATQTPQHILTIHETIPAHAGAFTLYYPKWIPGDHQPSGPIGNVAGLKFQTGGKVIPWRRDLLDVFTFHITVPEGASSVEADFQYLDGGGGPFGGSTTDKLVDINWDEMLLYPAGTPAQHLMFAAHLVLPEGWKFGTALPLESASGNQATFKPAALNRLVDSPLVAGEYYRDVDITPPGEPIHHEIDIVADSATALNMPPEFQKQLTNLVAESGKLFGARHYRDYHFLLTLSNHTAHFGLEHHESNDSRTMERAFLTPNGRRGLGGLLPHEFVHSWNGKFRRPADLSAPYYEAPMQTDLLWVYEGLTDYLGHLLAARSGIWTPEQFREYLANTAAELGPGRPGRTWRPLQDTADAVPGMFRGFSLMNWRRGVDYYPEGDLLWLEVATIIHDQSHGKKSFEDFCHSFYGGPNDGPQLKPYTFDELVAALNHVQPYDWAGFFHERLGSTSAEAPVGGIEAGGWKVDYTEKPPAFAGRGRFAGGVNAAYSIGLRLGGDGSVQDSIVGKPAFKAGIVPGMRVVAVNGRSFTPALLNDVLEASKSSTQQIQFLVLGDDYYHTYTVEYEGGPRFPHLVRVEGKPDLLDDLAKPLAAQK